MTVFVGRDTLFAVQGTGIEGADDVWDRVSRLLVSQQT
jgi:hypothetical protein